MGAISSLITSLMIVYLTVYSDADQRKHQSSASLAFVWGIHRGPVNSPHKWPVTRKMFPFDDVIMTRPGITLLFFCNDWIMIFKDRSIVAIEHNYVLVIICLWKGKLFCEIMTYENALGCKCLQNPWHSGPRRDHSFAWQVFNVYVFI